MQLLTRKHIRSIRLIFGLRRTRTSSQTVWLLQFVSEAQVRIMERALSQLPKKNVGIFERSTCRRTRGMASTVSSSLKLHVMTAHGMWLATDRNVFDVRSRLDNFLIVNFLCVTKII